MHLLTILLLSCVSLNAAIPPMFFRHTGTNVVEVGNTNLIETSLLFVEAEDWNSEAGQYFPSNPAFGQHFNATFIYNGVASVEEDDFHSASASGTSPYRSGTGVFQLANNAQRPGFLFGTDFALTNVASGDWFQYKRNWAGDCCFGTGMPTNYHVYLYVADHGSAAASVVFGLHNVTGTTNHLGTFTTTTSGDGAFAYVPLMHSSTNVILTLTTERSSRLTSSNDVSRIHHLKFAMLEPVIAPGAAAVGSTDAYINRHTTNAYVSAWTALAYRSNNP